MLQHTKKYIFCANLTKNSYNFYSFTPMAMIVLTVTVFFFFFDNLREKGPVPLTAWSGMACFYSPCGEAGENRHQGPVPTRCLAGRSITKNIHKDPLGRTTSRFWETFYVS